MLDANGQSLLGIAKKSISACLEYVSMLETACCCGVMHVLETMLAGGVPRCKTAHRRMVSVLHTSVCMLMSLLQ